MFDRGPHKRLDELAKDDFAGHCLRCLEHRPDIQLLDWRADGCGGGCRNRCVAEIRMKLFELPHLTIGSPTQIAEAGILQIRTGNLVEAACRIEAGRQFIGDRLIVNKAVFSGRADGLFIQAHRVDIVPLNAGNLCTDQRGAVLEIVRAIDRPELELPVVGRQYIDMLLPLVRRRGVRGCGMRQRAVELILCFFKVGWRCPQQPLRPRRGLHGRRITARKETCLQLADPVPALDKRQIRICRKTALDPSLIKLLIVKGAECRRQAAQRSDQPELAGDGINDKTEPRLLSKREAAFGFAFHLGKWIACREKVRVQFVTAVGGVSEIADLVCRLERAAHKIAAFPDMSRPGQNDIAKVHIGPCLETR